MTARYAIYFAPALDSPLWRRAMEWFDQPDLQTLTVSARRYGFHATIKAPMHLARPYGEFAEGLAGFARAHAPAALTGLSPRLIGGFLALTCAPQPEAVTDLAAEVVEAFEPFRLPPSASEIARRLKSPLTARQVELVERYGYPYVLEQFQFHMTLTDRLPEAMRPQMVERATAWFAESLAGPVTLDRLVVFTEREAGAPFERLDPDHILKGA